MEDGTEVDYSIPLKSSKREKFCQEIVKGSTAIAAYVKAYKCPVANATANANVARKAVEVNERIKYMQSQIVSDIVLTMKERREWLARVVRANVDNLDLEKDGDLVDEIIVDANGSKRFKLPSKRACIMDDAKLAGEIIDRSDITSGGGSIVPQIILNLPESFNTPKEKLVFSQPTELE
jgi:hypothetical protein